MAGSATPATTWRRLAAPDRHPPEGPVALPLFPSAVHRPASTIRGHVTARATEPTI